MTCGRIPDGFVFGLWFARSSATLRDVVSGVILQAEALDFAVRELEEFGEPDDASWHVSVVEDGGAVRAMDLLDHVDLADVGDEAFDSLES